MLVSQPGAGTFSLSRHRAPQALQNCRFEFVNNFLRFHTADSKVEAYIFF